MKTLYFNGIVHTLSDNGLCQALVTENENVIGMGYYCDMVQLAGPFAKRVDLNGASVIPETATHEDFSEAVVHLSPIAAFHFKAKIKKAFKTLEYGGKANMMILNCNLQNAKRDAIIFAKQIIKNGKAVEQIG